MFDPMARHAMGSRKWISGRFGVGLSPQNHPLKSSTGARWPSGLECWLSLATRRFGTVGPFYLVSMPGRGSKKIPPASPHWNV